MVPICTLVQHSPSYWPYRVHPENQCLYYLRFVWCISFFVLFIECPAATWYAITIIATTNYLQRMPLHFCEVRYHSVNSSDRSFQYDDVQTLSKVRYRHTNQNIGRAVDYEAKIISIKVNLSIYNRIFNALSSGGPMETNNRSLNIQRKKRCSPLPI